MKKELSKGVYVVVDPGMEADRILSQLDQLKNEELAALQIWENLKIKTRNKALEKPLLDRWQKILGGKDAEDFRLLKG